MPSDGPTTRERCQECGVDTDDVDEGLCEDCYAEQDEGWIADE